MADSTLTHNPAARTDPEPARDQASRPEAGLLARARSAGLVVARLADQSERERRLAPAAVEALTEAGFPGHFAPLEHGGAAGGFAEYVAAVAALAEGCASAGWCASLYASHSRLAAYLPTEGRRELWERGPHTRISAGVVPSGSLAPAPGGWRVTGRWPFVSGVDHADWVLLTGWDPTADDRRLRFLAVPRADFTVIDSWHNVGLRGTGSNTVEVDTYVPGHRSFLQHQLLAGTPPPPFAPCHALPFRLVNGLTMIAPALGAARGALRFWSAWMAGKEEVSQGRLVPAREKPSVQAALARASAEIDAVGLLIEAVTACADRSGAVTAAAVARSHRDHAVSAELLVSAVDRLFRAGGARAQDEASPVQRAWRDVNAAAGHAALQFDVNAAAYAAHVLAARD
jgi:two-component flavin-dependent monooxygenase